VSVTAVVTGLPPVTFNLTATPSAPPPAGGPRINTGGVVSAGLSTPALRTLSPGQIFSVFGEGFLAAGTAGRRVQAEEIVGGRLPTNLLAVCVEVNGTSAPVFDVFPGQVNAILPALPPGTAEVKVLKDCGRSTQVVSNAESVPVAARAPEFLYAAFAPGGGNPVAAISATSGEYIGPPNLGPAFRPARPGEIVSAFGVGFGMTSPEVMPGTTIPTVAPVMGRLAVLLGGIPLARADILYVGLAPGFYGLYQVNFRVPETTPVGDQSLVIAVDDISSPVSGRLSIAR
jgi:uncharacterized protein (TIGR03437 family)